MPSFFVGEGTECPASAGGDAWWSDGLELDEASDDQGTEGPGGVLSVQQVGFESSEQDVAVVCGWPLRLAWKALWTSMTRPTSCPPSSCVSAGSQG